MCWYSEKLKIKTAKKDIPVWKIVIGSDDSSEICYSLYAKFSYVKSVIKTSSINFEPRRYGKTIIGSTGFHSYSNKLKWERDNCFILIYKKKIFSNFKNYMDVVCQSDVRIARFRIPKGYQYAENRYGEIISSAIVFDGFID